MIRAIIVIFAIAVMVASFGDGWMFGG